MSSTTAVTRRLHPAWWVAAVTFVALIAAAGFRSSTGALLLPLEEEFGWTRSQTSLAVTVNLVLYGLTAPFAAALMERFGIRRVVAAALLLVAVGSGATVFMTQAWHLVLLWGVLVGLGTGSMALVFGAIVANRWFVRRRGLVTGVFSAASATGQLVFLPLVAHLAMHQGWRLASALTAAAALAVVPFVLVVLRDRPADLGVPPYGGDAVIPAPTGARAGFWATAASAVGTLRWAARTRTFWILVGTFAICGWSTNGLIGTHFIPAAHDHGMPEQTAANLLALVGIFDIVGTIASGWLTDRVDSRFLLVAYYGLRGLALLSVPAVLGPTVEPPLLFFIVFYGLDWVATVPPTVQLCRVHFGVERSGVVFGWVFASHMVGAGIAAAYAGIVRTVTGDYAIAWWTAGLLCVAAAAVVMAIRRVPGHAAVEPIAAP